MLGMFQHVFPGLRRALGTQHRRARASRPPTMEAGSRPMRDDATRTATLRRLPESIPFYAFQRGLTVSLPIRHTIIYRKSHTAVIPRCKGWPPILRQTPPQSPARAGPILHLARSVFHRTPVNIAGPQCGMVGRTGTCSRAHSPMSNSAASPSSHSNGPNNSV